MMLSTCQRLIIFNVLRTSGLIKEIIWHIWLDKFNFRMLNEFVLILNILKTLNIINLWHVDNITIKHATFIYAINSIRELVRLAQVVEQWTGNP